MSSPLKGKVFSLAGRGLKLTSRDDIAEHLACIQGVNDVEEFYLGGNSLGVGACQALAEVLARQQSLRVADLADIFTARLISEIPDALRALCDALVGRETLEEVNLSDNAFGGRSAEPMVNLLKNNHNFSVLKLNNNGLGVTGGKIVADALFSAAQELRRLGREPRLRTLICGRNRLEDGSAPSWAKTFAALGSLVEVRMFQNGIRMGGFEAIARGLAKCPGLRVLDLMDNTATLQGSRAIAACLPSWPDLRELNLSDCLLRPRGARLIFDALAKGANQHLEKLQLGYCEVDRDGLGALGRAIGANLSSLVSLDINGNWADEEDDCITSIQKALEKWGHGEAMLDLDDLDPDGELDEEEEASEAEQEEASEAREDEGNPGDLGGDAAVEAAAIGEKRTDNPNFGSPQHAKAKEATEVEQAEGDSETASPDGKGHEAIAAKVSPEDQFARAAGPGDRVRADRDGVSGQEASNDSARPAEGGDAEEHRQSENAGAQTRKSINAPAEVPKTMALGSGESPHELATSRVDENVQRERPVINERDNETVLVEESIVDKSAPTPNPTRLGVSHGETEHTTPQAPPPSLGHTQPQESDMSETVSAPEGGAASPTSKPVQEASASHERPIKLESEAVKSSSVAHSIVPLPETVAESSRSDNKAGPSAQVARPNQDGASKSAFRDPRKVK